MTRKTSLIARTGAFFARIGAANAVAAAVEAHRAPRARDLEILGINPDAFRRIEL